MMRRSLLIQNLAMALTAQTAKLPGAAKRQKRGLSPARLLTGIILAAAVAQTVRLARELKRYRASRTRLRTTWTAIPALAGGQPLCVRAVVSTTNRGLLPPIVLVHGYGIGTSYLVPLAAALADQAQVYAPDLPGHGPSDHAARPLTIPELAEALAAWMEASQLSGALLVGHSLGCQVAAEVAVRRPELVSGLVLIGPTADSGARSRARQIARGLRGALYERSSFAVWTTLDYSRAGARVLGEEMRQMVAHRIEDVLEHSQVPVWIVRGGRDRIVPQAWAESLARIAGAPTPTVIGCWGHAVHYDAPAEVARVILELAQIIRLTRRPPRVLARASTEKSKGSGQENS